ncbi:unnamed protein product [Rhizoctonia solani]|uniref:Transmembrane protein n=1 Tax=Rhizoctonia solani TaxID=456999 RepID=A0A8H3BHT4_9AGAM|nr:unnamed protein product [Rhizoctonia solani]
MLLAIPIIAAVVASYFQFTLIRNVGYRVFQPLMWDALEDLKGIMRRRMPFWMRPISAAASRLGLPSPIPTNDSTVITNQTVVSTPPEVSISGFDNFPFELPAQKTYYFSALCGAFVLLCLAGSYVLLTSIVTPASKASPRDHQQEYAMDVKSETAVHPVVHPSVPQIITLESVSGLISSKALAVDSADSAPSALGVSGPVNMRMPMAPIVPESHLELPIIGSTLPPASASESTWEELRVPSPTGSPDVEDPDLSRYWHREVVIMEGFPYDPVRARTGLRRRVRQDTTGRGLCATGSSRATEVDTGAIRSTPSGLPVIREESPNSQMPVIPQIIVEEYQKSSNASMVDGSTCPERSAKCPLETRSPQDAPVVLHPVADVSTRGGMAINESTTGQTKDISGGLDAGISAVYDSTGSSTLEATEHPESLVGGTPDLLQIQIDLRDLERNLARGSTASATWVGFVALRDSLVRFCSDPTARNGPSQGSAGGTAYSIMEDIDDFLPVSLPVHANAWANDSVHSLEPLAPTDSTSMTPDASEQDVVHAFAYSERERLRTFSNSSTSLGWMSQRSGSTHPDTPLITPSNSVPHVSQPDEPSCLEDPANISSPSMDFIFEDQLSQTTSPAPSTEYGSPLEGATGLDSFADIQPSGSASTLHHCSEAQMLQSFLDDRTYAEVAGVPSEIESARATLSLRRWRIPRPGPQRPQPNSPSPSRSGRSAPDVNTANWAGHGTANSMWARGPDPNSRGFESRRGRARRAQPV